MPGSSDHPRRAFSLVELIVAIGIFTLLMVGVSQVYYYFSRSVGATQALAGMVRNSRGAHTVIYHDLKAALTEEDPFFLIHNERRAAFLRASDMAADADGRPFTIDIDQDGAANGFGEDLSRHVLSPTYRNCRTDLLGFFARSLYRKQTGTGSQVVSPLGSRDAYVWYGHLNIPGVVGGSDYFEPGDADAASNAGNFFSSDWTLGRVVLLLNNELVDEQRVRQTAIDRTRRNPLLLAADAFASREPRQEYSPVYATRHDLVETSVADLFTTLRRFELDRPEEDWWSDLVYRFRADPSPAAPLNADAAALAAPVFVQHCRQFVVEYAGDFVTQLTDVRGPEDRNTPDGKETAHDVFDLRYGQVTAAVPDGRIDFYTVPTGARVRVDAEVRPGQSVSEVMDERIERVRFYGLPRDADNVGSVPGSATRTSALTGVVPLRDVVRSGAGEDGSLDGYRGAPWEREVPRAASDYAAPGALAPDAVYTCVWGPGEPRPKLLRIVLTIEDPSAQVGVGQTYEYVFQLNH